MTIKVVVVICCHGRLVKCSGYQDTAATGQSLLNVQHSSVLLPRDGLMAQNSTMVHIPMKQSMLLETTSITCNMRTSAQILCTIL